MSYDMIDRFLRNNLDDDNYAEYSDALNALFTPQRTWVGLTDEEVDRALDAAKVPELPGGYESVELEIARAIEAKLRSKNEDRN